ncbi:MAG: MATE family efflux transporter [Peptoniphilaceae bacterium]|nr:MATE family efflux transporter [Peptoniphilaceae bacterium]MDY6018772.1 MATE family efflux transporter [Anaerococcus sp.]
MKNKSEKLGTMPEGRLLFTMSLPVIISMLVQAIYNIVDSIFVSRISEEALAAVSISFPMQNIMIGVGVGIGVGVAALLGRFLGMNDTRRVEQTALHGFFMCLIAGMIFVLVGIFLTRPFIYSQSTSAQVRIYGHDYLSIVCICSFGVFLQIYFEKILQSTGLTVYTMLTQLTGAIINIILDPILIFGLFGFPRLEVKGAAIATIIGQLTGAFMGYLINKHKNLEIKLIFSDFKYSNELFREIFRIGLPSMIMNSIGSLTVYMMNLILKSFGQAAVAAFGVLFKLQSFVFMPIYGISNTMVAIVSYNYGARLKERIKKSTKIANISATLMILFGAALMQVFPEELLGLFHASNDLLKIGVPMLRTVSISYIPVGFSIVAVSIFQSLGNSKIAIAEPILRQIIVLVPLAYVFSLTGNINNIWLSFIFAEGIAAILCIVYLKKDFREKIDVL